MNPARADFLSRCGVRSISLLLPAGLVGCLVLFACQSSLSQPTALAPLPNRINPNTAPMGSLIRLEGIGPARAFDVIVYREARLPEGGQAFERAEDLEAIRGIGPKTVEKMAPWLIFE